jgi:hypothetical protein
VVQDREVRDVVVSFGVRCAMSYDIFLIWRFRQDSLVMIVLVLCALLPAIKCC